MEEEADSMDGGDGGDGEDLVDGAHGYPPIIHLVQLNLTVLL